MKVGNEDLGIDDSNFAELKPPEALTDLPAPKAPQYLASKKILEFAYDMFSIGGKGHRTWKEFLVAMHDRLSALLLHSIVVRRLDSKLMQIKTTREASVARGPSTSIESIGQTVKCITESYEPLDICCIVDGVGTWISLDGDRSLDDVSCN